MTKKIAVKKNKSKKKVKSKPMNKGILLFISIILAICIIGGLWFILSSTTTTVAQAQLVIESGTVQVKPVGESWSAAEDGMLLYQSDSVKTGDDSSASIIIFESSIIRLDSNTEVTIQELIQQDEATRVSFDQEVGRTWSTVSKISGIDSYEVQTPTTVASVRGTSIDVNVTSTGNTTVNVFNGSANISKLVNGTVVETIEAGDNESVSVGSDENETLETKPAQKDDWIDDNQQKDEELKGSLKEQLYARIEPYRSELRDRYGVTDEDLEIIMDAYLEGRLEIPEETPQWIRDIIELS